MSYANWNILPAVLTLIPKTPVQYRFALESSDNEFGQVVAGYGEWIDAVGIVQPAEKSMRHSEGIEITPGRVQVWICGTNLHATDGQSAPDQICYEGKIYNVISVNEWYAYDGWTNCICQEVRNI